MLHANCTADLQIVLRYSTARPNRKVNDDVG